MVDVTCAIILLNNKVLVTQRSENMSLPFNWEFPGGKIENNETESECLAREIKEELNIEIKLLKRLESQVFTYPEFIINLIPYICEYVSGKIILEEHLDYKWLRKEELIFLNWAPADIPVLEEFLKLNYDTTRTL